MDLRGYYADDEWPAISGLFQTPEGLARLDFLIDTGANRTLLSEEDATFVQLLANGTQRIDKIDVLGGTAKVVWRSAILSFVSESGIVYGYETVVGVSQSESKSYFPSLLGRDILNNWRLTIDGLAQTVQADVLRCDFQFEQ